MNANRKALLSKVRQQSKFENGGALKMLPTSAKLYARKFTDVKVQLQKKVVGQGVIAAASGGGGGVEPCVMRKRGFITQNNKPRSVDGHGGSNQSVENNKIQREREARVREMAPEDKLKMEEALRTLKKKVLARNVYSDVQPNDVQPKVLRVTPVARPDYLSWAFESAEFSERQDMRVGAGERATALREEYWQRLNATKAMSDIALRAQHDEAKQEDEVPEPILLHVKPMECVCIPVIEEQGDALSIQMSCVDGKLDGAEAADRSLSLEVGDGAV